MVCSNRTQRAFRLGETSVDCIVCGGELNFAPDAYPLVFRCNEGHGQTLRDVLDELLLHRKSPRASTVDFWEERSLLLRGLAGRALREGHVFAAADFQEAAGWVEQWVDSLRLLLTAR